MDGTGQIVILPTYAWVARLKNFVTALGKMKAIWPILCLASDKINYLILWNNMKSLIIMGFVVDLNSSV